MNLFKNAHRSRSVSTRLLAVFIACAATIGSTNIARAGVVSIWVNDGLSGWQQIATDPTGTLAFVGSYTTTNGAFKLTNSSASIQTFPTFSELNYTSFRIDHLNAGGVNNIQIAVVGTGYTFPTKAPITVKSQVSSTNIDFSLIYADFQSYVDPSNNAFPGSLAGGQGLQVPTTLQPISGPGASQTTVINSNLSSPYSVAQLFDITMAGIGHVTSLGGDTTLTAAVPEPTSITLICICVTGLGGFGWRRRKNQIAAETNETGTPPTV